MLELGGAHLHEGQHTTNCNLWTHKTTSVLKADVLCLGPTYYQS